jgi:uncharacterized protein (DUF488 family)
MEKKPYTIYLIGYGNQEPAAFLDRLEYLDRALVLDIRARRNSWCWDYRGDRLGDLLKRDGHQYLWIPDLGSVGYNGEMKLLNEPVGMMALEAQVDRSELPIVLLCAELRSSECHRAEVARRLADRLARRGICLEIRPL